MILQKTIQYVADYEIVDILASYAKMINGVNIIHYFIIHQLLDSIIYFTRSASENFRAARNNHLKIDPYSRAAASDAEKQTHIQQFKWTSILKQA